MQHTAQHNTQLPAKGVPAWNMTAVILENICYCQVLTVEDNCVAHMFAF